MQENAGLALGALPQHRIPFRAECLILFLIILPKTLPSFSRAGSHHSLNRGRNNGGAHAARTGAKQTGLDPSSPSIN